MANPTLLSVPLCRDAEKNTIPVTDNGTTGKFSEQYGWQGINSLPLSAGGKAVERLDFNGVIALLGGIDYMTQRGYTFEYDNTLPYVAGCIVVDPLDGKTYRCINDVPIGASNPSNDPINWIPYDIADYVGGALRSKAYKVGDTSTLVGIPAGYFLECTAAGTTATIAPVITTVTEEQTITDGTVVWTVRKCTPMYITRDLQTQIGSIFRYELYGQLQKGTKSYPLVSTRLYLVVCAHRLASINGLYLVTEGKTSEISKFASNNVSPTITMSDGVLTITIGNRAMDYTVYCVGISN